MPSLRELRPLEMKSILILGIFLFSLNSYSKDVSFTAKLKDMTCPMCASAVEKEVKKIEGFDKISVSISEGSVTVTGDNLSKDSVKEAINKTRFKVIKIKQNF